MMGGSSVPDPDRSRILARAALTGHHGPARAHPTLTLTHTAESTALRPQRHALRRPGAVGPRGGSAPPPLRLLLEPAGADVRELRRDLGGVPPARELLVPARAGRRTGTLVHPGRVPRS